VQYKIKFDRPPRLKKLPEALIISPELRHLYIHTTVNSMSFIWNDNMRDKREANANAT
jgi:hypothetical protein